MKFAIRHVQFLLVVVIFFALGCNTRNAPKLSPVMQSKAASETGAAQGFAKNLARPYWMGSPPNSASDWERIIQRSVEEKGSNFSIKERDWRVRDLSKSLGGLKQKADVRVLIVEHIFTAHGSVPHYSGSWFYASARENREFAAQVGELGLEPIEWKKWQTFGLENQLDQLFNKWRVPSGVWAGVYDVIDMAVISFFDGREWKVQPWANMAGNGVGAIAEWGNSQKLPDDVRSLYRLLHTLRTEMKSRQFQGESWTVIDDVANWELNPSK